MSDTAAYRHLPARAGLALMRGLAHLPLPVLAVLGRALGYSLYYLYAPRRRVVLINLGLCFPGLSSAEQRRLARRHFAALGQALFDTAVVWWAPVRRLRRLVRFVGRAHYDAALAAGKNVILLAPHFVALEVAGLYLSSERPAAALYKRAKHPVINAALRARRTRFGGEAIEKDEGLRRMVRALRSGRVFYYLPDQDLGREHSVFAPFFNVSTATVGIVGRLARLGKAVVIPCFTRQLPHGRGYEVIFGAPWQDAPEDAEACARRINEDIERAVYRMPEQYLWAHKRFKTRPDGERRVY